MCTVRTKSLPCNQHGLLSTRDVHVNDIETRSGRSVRCSTSVMVSGNQGNVLGHIRTSANMHSYCRLLHPNLMPHAFHAAGEQPIVQYVT